MSNFEESRWADSDYSREYREGADYYIPERAHLFHVLRSYFRRFVLRPDRETRICDLGCGDGILASQLLQPGAAIAATLVDGSTEMLAAARQRLGDNTSTRFLQRGFDELIRDSSVLGTFDFVVSGFAIHHLERSGRRELFRVVFDHLAPGGSFLNVEVALASSPACTEWYFELWRDWIAATGRRTGVGDQYQSIPDDARANPDNKYSPLEDQLADLRGAGFAGVECHHRNSVFAIYGGTKRAVA